MLASFREFLRHADTSRPLSRPHRAHVIVDLLEPSQVEGEKSSLSMCKAQGLAHFRKCFAEYARLRPRFGSRPRHIPALRALTGRVAKNVSRTRLKLFWENADLKWSAAINTGLSLRESLITDREIVWKTDV